MKKTILLTLSHLLVAVLASLATLGIEALTAEEEYSKVQELEDLILTCFIGETDQTALQDAAAEGMIDSLDDRWSYYISAEEYEAYAEQ